MRVRAFLMVCCRGVGLCSMSSRIKKHRSIKVDSNLTFTISFSSHFGMIKKKKEEAAAVSMQILIWISKVQFYTNWVQMKASVTFHIHEMTSDTLNYLLWVGIGACVAMLHALLSPRGSIVCKVLRLFCLFSGICFCCFALNKWIAQILFICLLQKSRPFAMPTCLIV